MKKIYLIIVLTSFICCISCNNKKEDKKNYLLQFQSLMFKPMVTVGEWEQRYTSFVKNANYTLEPEEEGAFIFFKKEFDKKLLHHLKFLV